MQGGLGHDGCLPPLRQEGDGIEASLPPPFGLRSVDSEKKKAKGSRLAWAGLASALRIYPQSWCWSFSWSPLEQTLTNLLVPLRKLGPDRAFDGGRRCPLFRPVARALSSLEEIAAGYPVEHSRLSSTHD